jgi:hypothetical protein
MTSVTAGAGGVVLVIEDPAPGDLPGGPGEFNFRAPTLIGAMIQVRWVLKRLGVIWQGGESGPHEV